MQVGKVVAPMASGISAIFESVEEDNEEDTNDQEDDNKSSNNHRPGNVMIEARE